MLAGAKVGVLVFDVQKKVEAGTRPETLKRVENGNQHCIGNFVEDQMRVWRYIVIVTAYLRRGPDESLEETTKVTAEPLNMLSKSGSEHSRNPGPGLHPPHLRTNPTPSRARPAVRGR